MIIVKGVVLWPVRQWPRVGTSWGAGIGCGCIGEDWNGMRKVSFTVITLSSGQIWFITSSPSPSQTNLLMFLPYHPTRTIRERPECKNSRLSYQSDNPCPYTTPIVTRGELMPYIRSHTYQIATQHPSKHSWHLAKMADALVPFWSSEDHRSLVRGRVRATM